MNRERLAIGWDVGGWRGNKQAVAVARWEDDHPVWEGTPSTFSIADVDAQGGTLDDLVAQVWTICSRDVLALFQVVLAIDAPLGFPRAFRALLDGQAPAAFPLDAEIENPLAYRDTDRHVFRTFGKKPLSASFDKLGNVATVAMAHARQWVNSHDLFLVPQQAAPPGASVIIEVYPALLKGKDGRLLDRYRKLLPRGLTVGSDTYDAAICALHALAFETTRTNALPLPVGPPSTMELATRQTEGWIYHFPRPRVQR